ncbi:conjugal transfer protein TraX [Paenibacillus spongiae]|uniref:Conjugal transfer protein TraX n=1 Tax=Paenibacillus spongiae TaxID=2909671 RepID=A0ABY5SB44_9BACL|nr:conjugal transfer protein TraX [Paenibacillus spongiae]UVI31151.1 conjugal transfer protein TraX [Paenibacillus spongiae]
MLHLIALATMAIDHIGIVFFGDYAIFRIIGRIAFPLYCWFLVQGYLLTKNVKRYLLRLLGLACLSQIPYMLALQQWELNVIFTLIISLICLYVLDLRIESIYKTLLIIGAALFLMGVPIDYGLYGLMLVLGFRYLKGFQIIIGHTIINVSFLFEYGLGSSIQLYSILGTLLIYISQSFKGMNMNRVLRWIYRGFYPAHLALIYILQAWMD